ncbi:MULTISPECIES: ABC transporter permease [unclassified Fusibacter]|uniref:ABC transporter permease n=1 Tax=unclassified Fusibacter TaxID=2624464 RepID=UPI001012C9F0|nr:MULTISPECIES: ABC transporter permease [unclassified Fusibacter]MCK8059133.1 ABC transporter permease [Fusibacter sp. A2]NPE22542.1 ABC transporter permease [Fusibacter sp. A1]RXV60644.1 ABC transporter permease [Fusibacter sp. A1]
MSNSSGTRTLTRFIIRRDRTRIIIWITLLTLMSLYVALFFPTLYPSDSDTAAIAEALDNPGIVAMLGPYYGDASQHSLGAIYSAEMQLLTMLAVATMNILLVTRHTRKDEEEGRHEVIRALPVSKSAILASTLLVYSIVNLMLALFIGISLTFAGTDFLDLNGSLLYGASLGTIGLFFATATGVFAQLTQSSRSTLRYAFGFLGLMYMLRAYGDVSSEGLSLSVPLGLILRTKPYTANQWWPILVILVISAVLAYLAFRLNDIRDLEASFVPDKPGRKTASVFLRGIFSLAWRTERMTILWWAVAMMMLGASYGSVLGDIESFFTGNELYQNLIKAVGGTGTMVDRFVVLLIVVISMASTIPTAHILMKLRSEEKHNHIEHLLGRSVSRFRILFSYVTLAVVVSLIMSFFGTYGLYSVGSSVSTSPLSFSTMMRGSLAYLPAVWIFIGLSVLLLGTLPRVIKLTWVYLGFSFGAVYFEGIFQVPGWMVKLSPFAHVPKIPVEDYSLASSALLMILAILLITLGAVTYRTRDLDG